MQVSNTLLVVLLVATVIISVAGTFLNISRLDSVTYTGRAPTDTGRANLTVTSSVGIVVSDVDLGSGSTVSGSTVYLSTEIDNTAISGITGWKDCTSDATCQGMLINNTGNVRVNVTFGANVTGSSLFSSPSTPADAWFRYWVMNGTAATAYAHGTVQGCNNITTAASWGNVPSNETQSLVCNNLTSGTNNVMHVEFNLTLAEDEPTGEKVTYIYVEAEDCSASALC